MSKPIKYNWNQLAQAWANERRAADADAVLIGKWFHSWQVKEHGVGTPPKMIEWQGNILGAQPGNYFLVQLYSWWDGAPSEMQLVPFMEMIEWTFYESREQMLSAYERYDEQLIAINKDAYDFYVAHH